MFLHIHRLPFLAFIPEVKMVTFYNICYISRFIQYIVRIPTGGDIMRMSLTCNSYICVHCTVTLCLGELIDMHYKTVVKIRTQYCRLNVHQLRRMHFILRKQQHTT